MREDEMPVPAIRTWRDIPQPVKPRVMSRGGRWRRTKQVLRGALLVSLALGLAAAAWWLAGMVGAAPRHVPAVAKTAPLRHLELRTSVGGVLDAAWLERKLALPRGTALMDLDLERLRVRLLADRQVVTATIVREFPDRLMVSITERAPVARVRVEAAGQVRDLLVAPDGVVFAGEGFDPAMLATLPWLAGIALVPEGSGFRPLPGMATVAQLLSDAQLSARRLYEGWMTVSLARLASDRELEVTTRNGTVVVFNAAGDYFGQLATLDYLIDRLADTPMARAHIDLTLGRNVPVRIEPPAAPAGGEAVPAPPFSSPAHPTSSLSR